MTHTNPLTMTDNLVSALTVERIKSVGVLAAQFVTLVNAGLSILSVNPLPFTDSQAGTAVSMILVAAVQFWAWWRHNVMTKAASVGHNVTRGEKAASVLATTTTVETAKDADTATSTTNTSGTIGLTDSEITDILNNYKDTSNDA